VGRTAPGTLARPTARAEGELLRAGMEDRERLWAHHQLVTTPSQVPNVMYRFGKLLDCMEFGKIISFGWAVARRPTAWRWRWLTRSLATRSRSPALWR